MRSTKGLSMYRKGFWLILIENDGSELAVACQLLSRSLLLLRLQALIPPSWYPQTFTAFKVREDGKILGFRRLPGDKPIQVPAHAGLHSVDLELTLPDPASPRDAVAGSHGLTAPGD